MIVLSVSLMILDTGFTETPEIEGQWCFVRGNPGLELLLKGKNILVPVRAFCNFIFSKIIQYSRFFL
jgi:hypothetical protein